MGIVFALTATVAEVSAPRLRRSSRHLAPLTPSEGPPDGCRSPAENRRSGHAIRPHTYQRAGGNGVKVHHGTVWIRQPGWDIIVQVQIGWSRWPYPIRATGLVGVTMSYSSINRAPGRMLRS
jgi:hypothetical protein